MTEAVVVKFVTEPVVVEFVTEPVFVESKVVLLGFELLFRIKKYPTTKTISTKNKYHKLS